MHVTGAVADPGVHSLKEGDRWDEAVQAAGGATDDADLAAVNLALRLRDEDKVHIPRQGEAPPTPSATAVPGPAGTPGPSRTCINSATASELEELIGIGPILAQRIVDYRDANGPFSSLDGLLDVSGIGTKTLDGFRDQAAVC